MKILDIRNLAKTTHKLSLPWPISLSPLPGSESLELGGGTAMWMSKRGAQDFGRPARVKAIGVHRQNFRAKTFVQAYSWPFYIRTS